jgi:hypothetical protein
MSYATYDNPSASGRHETLRRQEMINGNALLKR